MWMEVDMFDRISAWDISDLLWAQIHHENLTL